MPLGAMVVKLLCRDCFQHPPCFAHIDEMIRADGKRSNDLYSRSCVWNVAAEIRSFHFHFAFLFDKTCWQNSLSCARNSSCDSTENEKKLLFISREGAISPLLNISCEDFFLCRQTDSALPPERPLQMSFAQNHAPTKS